ncbi:3552_t:CDS:10, partial [Acaulospora colombiana]
VVIHQINNLERQNLKGASGDAREGQAGQDTDEPSEQGSNLPSGYCEIIVNDDMVYKTRVKQYTSMPFFEAGTEVFIRNWQETVVRVVVRDSRLREKDPILGIVNLPLAEVLKEGSEVTRLFSIQEGVGFGRANISVLFKAVDAKLPPHMLGWDTGTVEILKPIEVSIEPEHQSSFSLSKQSLVVTTTDSTEKIGSPVGDSDNARIIWNVDTVRLPVYSRYTSSLTFEIGSKGGVGPMKGKPSALAIIWLQDYLDDEEIDIKVPVIVSKDLKTLRQNYINEHTAKGHEYNIVGWLTTRIRIDTGLDPDHEKYAKSQARRHTYEAYDHIEGQALIAERNAHAYDDGVIDKKEKKALEAAHKKQLQNRHRGIAQFRPYRTAIWMKEGIKKRVIPKKSNEKRERACNLLCIYSSTTNARISPATVKLNVNQRACLFSTSITRRSSTLPKTIRQLIEEGNKSVQNEKISNLEAINSTKAQDSVIHGWVKSVRKQKHVAFVQLSDGTERGSRGLQLVFENPSLVDGLTMGSSIKATGSLVRSLGKGQEFEFNARDIEIVGACDPEKSHTIEYLREHANFRPRTEEIARMLKLRHAAKRAFEDYFDKHNFTYINTPLITTNDCEGAGEVFQVIPDTSAEPPTTPSPDTSSESSPHFFADPAYLTVSSQLHLEVFASAFSRVYTLQPAFRAERSHTSRHLSEFWMLEAEMAFMNGLENVMDVVEASIKNVCDDGRVRACAASEEQLLYLDSLRASKWKRITYTEVVSSLRSALGDNTIQWGESISTEQERWIADEIGEGLPVFVTDYPKDLKPFYMKPNPLTEMSQTVSCFDLLVPRVGELAG